MLFLESRTILGSLSFCCMIALEYSLSFSNLLGEPSLHQSYTHLKKGNEISIDDVRMGSYVSCLYEKEWYDGINEEVSVEENDVLVKFLHPTDPSVHLNWPAIDSKCWVPVNHILHLLAIPTVNTSRHPYTFLKSELKDTQKQFTENL